MLPTVREFFEILLTFSLTVFAWIFFRAESVGHAFRFIREILSPSLFENPGLFSNKLDYLRIMMVFIFIFIEWIGRRGEYAIEKLPHLLVSKKATILRWGFYLGLIICIFYLKSEAIEFIYFQF